jgi:acetolactate synthase I/II/III large subunit
MKIKVADYIIKFFADKGIDKMFVVYGAANGDLIDAFTRIKKTKYVSIMHEQAAGFAVEGYAKIKNLPGVAIATSGPGGQNFVTSIANCFYDSVPAIFITGQIKTQFLRPDERVRQIGFQETDIVGITKPITKKSVMITDVKKIKFELEHCYHLATTGRPGPILLDVPMDIQKQFVDINKLKGFKPKKDIYKRSKLLLQIKKFIKDFKKSKRPALLIGGGVRTSGAIKELQQLGKLMNVPVFPTWNALDIVTSDYSHYCGRVGTYGGAGRNFGIQNSDLLMTIGCRLSGRITGGNVQSFAREAKKYMVDIDQSNLKTKWQQLKFDENIYCDAKEFIKLLTKELIKNDFKKKLDNDKKQWLNTCIKWKNKYDPVKKEFFGNHNYIHPYAFIRTLSEKMEKNDTFVADCGGNIVISNHSFETKLGQRYFTNNGNSPMGFSFAGGLGACVANPKVNTVCVIGDGGMNMNIQELATLTNYKIKLKTIILNNHIYGITKAYQKTNFNGRMEACGPIGYNPPDFIEICKAYKVKTMELTQNSQSEKIIDEFLRYDDGPVVLDVNCHEYHTYEPRIFGWNTPIEDMYPYVSRKEFIGNMKIKPLDGWEKPALPDSDKKNKENTME